MDQIIIENEYVELFFIRAAIPVVKDRKNMPEGMENSNLLWDAIWRAHRDVLTARHNVSYYYANDLLIRSNGRHRDSNNNEMVDNMINRIPVDLYSLLSCEKEKSFKPRKIIKDLYEKYNRAVKVGAIQKLVNMTFKYLYLYNCCKMQDTSTIHIKFKITDCDCPLDSIILSKIQGYTGPTWTNIESFKDYVILQNTIKKLDEKRIPLRFDFKYYNDPIVLV